MDYKLNAIIRLIVTLVLAINSLLTASGHNPIPFDENAFTEWATYTFGVAMVIWSWWKDAPITKLAQKKYKEFKDGVIRRDN